MSYSYNDRGLKGRQLYIAVGAWLVLVIVGGFCTWYGWFGPASEQDLQTETEATPISGDAAAVIEPTAAPPTLAPDAPPPPADEPATEEVFGYGIAINGTGGGDINYWMGQVESLGMGWVKQQVEWAHFEGNPGQMDWSGYDAVVDAANQRGIKVMLSVVDAPLWSRTYLDNNIEGAPPDDLTLVADFLGRLVDRYQGRVHAIEVWNEQNLDREWDTAEGVNAARYVEMLRLAYQAIKSRDPNIIVISGALSPVGASYAEGERVIYMDDFDYFDGMVAAGLLSYCDCVGAHHNGINMPPNIAWKGTMTRPRNSAAPLTTPITVGHSNLPCRDTMTASWLPEATSRSASPSSVGPRQRGLTAIRRDLNSRWTTR